MRLRDGSSAIAPHNAASNEPDISTPNDLQHSVNVINKYSAEFHDFIVRSDIHPDKGRVLISNRDFKCGDTIFSEHQLRAVCEDKANPAYQELCNLVQRENFSLPALWYWCALNSLITESIYKEHSQESSVEGFNVNDLHGISFGAAGDESEKDDEQPILLSKKRKAAEQPSWKGLTVVPDVVRMRLEMLYRPEPRIIGVENKFLINTFNLEGIVSEEDMEDMIQIWVYNCFDYSDDPIGYSIYFLPSFCSHSCLPNAVWRLEENGTFTLGARLDIDAGEEITISYLGEDSLVEPAFKRQRSILSTKSFLCTCQRCTAPADISRGFACPKCHEGTIFLSPQIGMKTTDLLLFKQNDNCLSTTSGTRPPDVSFPVYATHLSDLIKRDSVFFKTNFFMDYLNQFCPFVCYSCDYHVTIKEVKKMIAAEQKMIKYLKKKSFIEDSGLESNDDEETPVNGQTNLIDDNSNGATNHCGTTNSSQKLNLSAEDRQCSESRDTESTDRQQAVESKEKMGEIQYLDDSINTVFRHHWICLKLEENAEKMFRSHNNLFDALKRHCRCLLYAQRMFCAPSGTLGWYYEELADLTLLYEYGYSYTNKKKSPFYFKPYQIKKLMEDNSIQQLYREAQRLLVCLFNHDHQYTLSVQHKLDAFENCIKASRELTRNV